MGWLQATSRAQSRRLRPDPLRSSRVMSVPGAQIRAHHVHTTRTRTRHTAANHARARTRQNIIPLPVIVDSGSGQSTHSKVCLRDVAPAVFCPGFGLPAVGPWACYSLLLAGLAAVARRLVVANSLQTPRSSPAVGAPNSRGNRRLPVPVKYLRKVARSAVAHSVLSIPGKQACSSCPARCSCTPEHREDARLRSAMQTDMVPTAISTRGSVLPVQ